MEMALNWEIAKNKAQLKQKWHDQKIAIPTGIGIFDYADGKMDLELSGGFHGWKGHKEDDFT